MQSLHYSTALEVGRVGGGGGGGTDENQQQQKKERGGAQEEKNGLFVLAHDAGVPATRLENNGRIHPSIQPSIGAGWRGLLAFVPAETK